MAPRVVAQGPHWPADKPHRRREEGGISIQDGTDDTSEERMRSSDLKGVRARDTPLRPWSSFAAY